MAGSSSRRKLARHSTASGSSHHSGRRFGWYKRISIAGGMNAWAEIASLTNDRSSLMRNRLCALPANDRGSRQTHRVLGMSAARERVQIVDMKEPFSLTRLHLVSLCDAFIGGRISPDALKTIGFALLASDTFDWDDDVISEVLSDWSVPEVNYELTAESIRVHREWLMGNAAPPRREFGVPEPRTGRLVSVRTKTAS